jgi:arylsulfatase B
MHAVTALAALLSQGVVAVAQKPHLIFVMVDDYGWSVSLRLGVHGGVMNHGFDPHCSCVVHSLRRNNVGFHAKNNPNSDEVVTPNMDALAASGIELDRHYAFRFCSPSRSSFNTGRFVSLSRRLLSMAAS